MKRIYLLLMPLILLAACKKDHSASTNPANYELVSVKVYYSDSLNQSLSMTYDPGTHLLTDFNQILVQVAAPDTTYYHLVYTNGQVSRISETIQGNTYNSDYHYNSKGWTDTIQVYFSNGQLEEGESQAFVYNDAGQITDVLQFSSTHASGHLVNTYDAAGHLIQTVDSSLFPHPTWGSTATYANFDDKANPMTAVKGFPAAVSWGNVLELPSPVSPNNPRTTTLIIPENATGQTVDNTANLVYTYNAAGLPTKIVNGMQTTTLTYQQY